MAWSSGRPVVEAGFPLPGVEAVKVQGPPAAGADVGA